MASGKIPALGARHVISGVALLLNRRSCLIHFSAPERVSNAGFHPLAAILPRREMIRSVLPVGSGRLFMASQRRGLLRANEKADRAVVPWTYATPTQCPLVVALMFLSP